MQACLSLVAHFDIANKVNTIARDCATESKSLKWIYVTNKPFMCDIRDYARRLGNLLKNAATNET